MSSPQLNTQRWARGVPKKIALVLGGGGSLGAYEAGALTETMYALDTFNSFLRSSGDTELFTVDIVTGASAGGMSAAMTARVMLYDLGLRVNLYNAWVHDIDIDGLLKDDKNQQNSILCKDTIKSIAARYLVSPPTRVTNRASFAPDCTRQGAPGPTSELRFGLTLSNMNGLDYILDTTSVRQSLSNPPITTCFADSAYFDFNSGTFATFDWAGLAQTAIACGNFPIAFQPQTLLRRSTDYPENPLQLQTVTWPRNFAFIDGGMFDNEPLGKAINLASSHDANGNPDPARLFLTIHPNITRSDYSDEITSQSSLLSQVGRILNMLLAESAIADWIDVSNLNRRAGWRDEFVKGLASILQSTSAANAAPLIASLSQLALEIARTTQPANANSYLATALANVRSGHGALMQVQGSGNGRQIFELMIFILDHIANLQHKSKIWFEVIGHDPTLNLAGEQMNGFAGFCDPNWREYDYRRGRFDAWMALSGWSSPNQGQQGWNGQWWNGTTVLGNSNVSQAILGVYDREPLSNQPTSWPKSSELDSEYCTDITSWRQRTAINKFPVVSYRDLPHRVQDAIKDRLVTRIMAQLDLGCFKKWGAGMIVPGIVDDFLRRL